MENIKLIVSEIDGVITDGTVPIDELGNIPYKNFNLEDFEAINELKKSCRFVFISSDNQISYHLCRRKKIPFYWSHPKPKRDILLDVMRHYNVTADQTIYVGSKLSDIECMNMIPFSFCPNNSNSKLLSIGNTLNADSGKGILVELYFKYFMSKKYMEAVDVSKT